MICITQIKVQGNKGEYVFDVRQDVAGVVATCEQPNGGLNTEVSCWRKLEEALIDCVETWESA